MKPDDTATNLILKITDQIFTILQGHPDGIQGAVIADLLARWVAGHSIEGEGTTSETTVAMRNGLLKDHQGLVNRLVSVYDAVFYGDPCQNTTITH